MNSFRLGQKVRFNRVSIQQFGDQISMLKGTVTSQVMTLGDKTFIGIRWDGGRFTLTPIEQLELNE